MNTQEYKPDTGRKDEPYNEERDPSTPYLNPGYRVDLYENSWFNVFLIVIAILGFIAGVFGYFLIFFGPLTTGIMYHYDMWWAFLIIFGLTVAVYFVF